MPAAATGFDVDQLLALGRVSELVVTPDHQAVIAVVGRVARKGDRMVANLWRVPLDGGPAVQLTVGDHRDQSPRFSGAGDLGFLSDRPGGAPPASAVDGADSDGDARTQLWVLPAAGGEPRRLTDEPLGVDDFAFVADGWVLLVEVDPDAPTGSTLPEMRRAITQRDKEGPTVLTYRAGEQPRHWDSWLPRTSLHLIHQGSAGRRDLTPGARHHLRSLLVDQKLVVSPDGNEVCVTWATRSRRDRVPETVLRCFDLPGGRHRDLGGAARVSYADACYAPDGKSLVAVRSELLHRESDRVTLWRFAGADGGGQPIAADWDTRPTLHGFTADGQALLCTHDHEGATPLVAVGLDGARVVLSATGSHKAVRAVGAGRPGGAGDARVVMVRSRLTHAPDVFVHGGQAGAEPTPLANLSGFSPARGLELAAHEVCWTGPSAEGGARIQYHLVTPRGVTRPPILMWIHGGPVGQDSDEWHWRWCVFVAVAAGYAVVTPNPRGSTGRGKAFVDGVFANTWGAACYRDLMLVADEVAARPDLDATRFVAMGGSFGGYMVNWIGTQTHRFRALVSHAGIYALPGFFTTTDYPTSGWFEFGALPWTGEVDYARYSPDAHATGWKTPVLIIHGERDYRVPIGEAIAMYDRLEAQGVDCELAVFPDEGHWIQRPRNIRAWYQLWQRFVAERLTAP